MIAVNVVRICSLYFVGVYAPSIFDVAHIDVWPVVIILAAAGEFVGWTYWMSREPQAVAAQV